MMIHDLYVKQTDEGMFDVYDGPFTEHRPQPMYLGFVGYREENRYIVYFQQFQPHCSTSLGEAVLWIKNQFLLNFG